MRIHMMSIAYLIHHEILRVLLEYGRGDGLSSPVLHILHVVNLVLARFAYRTCIISTGEDKPSPLPYSGVVRSF
jgi:hypothetical protein